MTTPRLTPRMEAFAQAYHISGNATDAYRQAYNTKNYKSENGIAVNASKLLADTKVSLRITELRQPTEHKYALDKATLVRKAWDLFDSTQSDGIKRQLLDTLGRWCGLDMKTINVNETTRHEWPEGVKPTTEAIEALAHQYKVQMGVAEPLALTDGGHDANTD